MFSFPNPKRIFPKIQRENEERLREIAKQSIQESCKRKKEYWIKEKEKQQFEKFFVKD
jgi:hypothetical protein